MADKRIVSAEGKVARRGTSSGVDASGVQGRQGSDRIDCYPDSSYDNRSSPRLTERVADWLADKLMEGREPVKPSPPASSSPASAIVRRTTWPLTAISSSQRTDMSARPAVRLSTDIQASHFEEIIKLKLLTFRGEVSRSPPISPRTVPTSSSSRC